MKRHRVHTGRFLITCVGIDKFVVNEVVKDRQEYMYYPARKSIFHKVPPGELRYEETETLLPVELSQMSGTYFKTPQEAKDFIDGYLKRRKAEANRSWAEIDFIHSYPQEEYP